MSSSHPPLVRRIRRASVRTLAIGAVVAAMLAMPGQARASLLSPELEDKLATFIALFVLFVVPVVLIVLFWMVHVLPEKIAHKRHHPQRQAIQTLCLLSLVFGGLLWPLAWLWAYTKPIGYKIAYGTEKHESWFEEMGDKARAGASTAEEVRHLLGELQAMRSRGTLPPALQGLLAELESLRGQAQQPPPVPPSPARPDRPVEGGR